MSGLALVLLLVVGACASPPVKIAQRALEARGTSDIVKDNEIVVDVNKLMATYETVAVSTEIYEQRLLVYGLLDDAAKVENFRGDVAKLEGVKACVPGRGVAVRNRLAVATATGPAQASRSLCPFV